MSPPPKVPTLFPPWLHLGRTPRCRMWPGICSFTPKLHSWAEDPSTSCGLCQFIYYMLCIYLVGSASPGSVWHALHVYAEAEVHFLTSQVGSFLQECSYYSPLLLMDITGPSPKTRNVSEDHQNVSQEPLAPAESLGLQSQSHWAFAGSDHS